MTLNLTHPAEIIASVMERIYQNGLTTTSGGNLSIMDKNGDIWITPAGIDKGSLDAGDICRISYDGQFFGKHKPSMEWPFHSAIYKTRPDIRAVLHAHPPALVAFSIARIPPDIQMFREAYNSIGLITMAAYACPGTRELGENIAAEFKKGFDSVILENHGVVIGALDMNAAFMKFETLEFAATLEVNVCRLHAAEKKARTYFMALKTADIEDAFAAQTSNHPRFLSNRESEQKARSELIKFVRRGVKGKIFYGYTGSFSVRFGDGFLITPPLSDKTSIEAADLLKISKSDSRPLPLSITTHCRIYEKHPHIHAVIGATPPHAAVFAVSKMLFDPRIIPESYIMLRDVRKISESEELIFSERTPVLIRENDQIFTTGDTALLAFDRMEVMESAAKSIISTLSL